MKVLVTGANGQLGSDVIKVLKQREIKCFGTCRKNMDITDWKRVRLVIRDYCPDIVIHCAAYTAVDKAEDEVELCKSVNVAGTRNIAEACREINAKMMYISTDYVFDGKKRGIYETEEILNPLSIYGKSKAMGELAVRQILDKYFIIRTSWLFGKNGNNFIKAIISAANSKNIIDVVKDQIGSPTYASDLVPLLIKIIQSEKFGIYHATNEGFCSWAEFAEEIVRMLKLGCVIHPVKSSEYRTKALRPKNSRLSKEKLLSAGFYKLPTWQDALRRYLSVIKKCEETVL